MILAIHRERHSRGFTLIELMVTIVIGAVLLSIAVPSYQAQIRKSRRVEARNALLDLAAREERFFSVSNAYTNDPASLGYPAGGFASTAPIGSGYYYISVPTVVAADPTVPTQASFSITATYTGVQTRDTNCANFTVTNTGRQSATNSGGTDSTTTCWN
jgi:type IV pilus assembly protein PilE